LKGDRRVKLSSQELEALFDYGYYTRYVGHIFQRLGLAGTPARA